MVKNILARFERAYEKRYRLYSGITAAIFLLQVVHLYWLTTHVVMHRALGWTLFDPSELLQITIIVVDYLEIPAIIGTSLLYVYSLNKRWNAKDFLLLVLLNSQWLHLFWISDEFVVDMFSGKSTQTILSFWLAWVAIAIDYLELPVMYDTTKKFLFSFLERKRASASGQPSSSLFGGDSVGQ